MADTTAITIVSVSAGAVVAITGSVLNATFARRQAERQFVHERDMADRQVLRAYLREVLSSLQTTIDYVLGLASDLDSIAALTAKGLLDQAIPMVPRWRRAGRGDGSNESLSVALAEQAQAISDAIEDLRTHMVGISLMVGGTHPLATTFTDLLRRALACQEAVPGSFPPSDEERVAYESAWTSLADGQRDFLKLAAELVGVKLAAPPTEALSHRA